MALSLVDTKPKEEKDDIVPVVSKKTVQDTPKKKTKTHSKTSSKKAKSKKSAKKEYAKGPYMVTFSSKEIRKFYFDNKWYYAYDDVAEIPNTDKKSAGFKEGDEEKLKKAKKSQAKEIEYHVDSEIKKIKVLDENGVIEVVQNVKGSLPGSFYRWLEETSSQEYQTPEPVREHNTLEESQVQHHPTDAGG